MLNFRPLQLINNICDVLDRNMKGLGSETFKSLILVAKCIVDEEMTSQKHQALKSLCIEKIRKIEDAMGRQEVFFDLSRSRFDRVLEMMNLYVHEYPDRNSAVHIDNAITAILNDLGNSEDNQALFENIQ